MKNEKILVSIIVPIYGVEKYIASCIDSILNQTYENFELILVDDGSPDKSGVICEKYAISDKRIKVFHKENGGLSDARNYGLSYANGEYVTFIDSDDLVEKNFLETLVNPVVDNGVEISCVNSYTAYERTLKKNNNESKMDLISGSEALKRGLLRRGFGVSAWGKLYKKDLFNDIEFPKGKLYEDIQTIPFLFLKCNKIACNNAELYLWYQREDSIMHTKVDEKHLCFFDDLRLTMDRILMINAELKDAFICRYCDDTFSTIVDRLVYDNEYSKKIKIAKIKGLGIWKQGLKNPYLSKKRKLQLKVLLFNVHVYKVSYKMMTNRLFDKRRLS